jgi:6-phospho-3-hexuloisomerase
VGNEDLVIVSAGPGDMATARALVCRARKAGARTALITAKAKAPLTEQVDVMTIIPAQTMADDTAANASILPIGTLFEAAQMLFFEMVVLKLRPYSKRR